MPIQPTAGQIFSNNCLENVFCNDWKLIIGSMTQILSNTFLLIVCSLRSKRASTSQLRRRRRRRDHVADRGGGRRAAPAAPRLAGAKRAGRRGQGRRRAPLRCAFRLRNFFPEELPGASNEHLGASKPRPGLPKFGALGPRFSSLRRPRGITLQITFHRSPLYLNVDPKQIRLRF